MTYIEVTSAKQGSVAKILGSIRNYSPTQIGAASGDFVHVRLSIGTVSGDSVPVGLPEEFCLTGTLINSKTIPSNDDVTLMTYQIM